MALDPSASRSGGVFSDNPNYQGAWICYMNGIEVPIMGYETQCGVWQIPSFKIHLVPDPMLQRLGSEDRIPVQIFILDQWIDIKNPEWRMLIDGETVGWSYSNTAGGRSVTFQCMAHIHVFQQLYFFYMTNVDDVVASQSPEAQTQGFTQAGLQYPYALFHQGLFVTQEQLGATAGTGANPGENTDGVDAAAPIKTPYELVTNVVKGVISSVVPNERRAVPMMNFFARHIRKTRFHNRWVRLPIFEDADRIGEQRGVFPIFNAARNDEALIAMQRQMASQVSNSGPVWNLFQQLLSTVYMEIGMLPNPACVRVTLGSGVGDPNEGRIIGGISNDTPLVQQRDPNVVSQEEASITSEANRLVSTIQAALRNETQVNNLDQLLQDAGFTYRPTADEVLFSAVEAHIRRQRVVRAAGGGDGPAREAPAQTGVDPRNPTRLAQYFVKPQFYFGVPPHCNVIFPSMIKSWTFDESYINQPTRIYVNDSVMTRLLRSQGTNRDFMLHALTVSFPEEADAIMHHRIASTAESGSGATPGMQETGKNLLIWPQEFYQGPVTARLPLPSWFQMLRQFSNATKDNTTVTDPTAAPLATAPTSTANSTSLPASTGPVPNVSATPQPLASGAVNEGGPNITMAEPTVSTETRGATQLVVRERARPEWPFRWIISPEALRVGDTKFVRSDPFPRYAELTPTRRGYQQEPSRYLTVLANHLRERFPGVISRLYLTARPPRLPIDPNKRVDPHMAGRAVDLMVNTVRVRREYSLPDLTRMSPIAEYLVANADVFGVQYFIWARSQWFGSSPAGRKFRHYSVKPESETFDHSNHIHLELNLDAANGLLPFYGGNRPGAAARPQAPVRTVYGPPPRVLTNEGTTALPTTGTAPAEHVTVAGAPQNATVTPNSEDSFAALFRLYAQSEYLRQRYMQRQASASMHFNPYIVPGFPCMLFDSPSSKMHIVAYVQNVVQVGMTNGQSSDMSTNVSLTCARTLPEFMNDVRADAERFRGRVTAAPAEIISTIREIIQDDGQAELFYRQLLHAGNPPPSGNAAFKFTDAIGYSRDFGVENIDISGASVAEVEAQDRAVTESRNEDGEVSAAASDAAAARSVTHNIDPTLELSPKEPYDRAFDNYDIAMRMNARPVCTLNEFIRFWHGGRTIGDCIGSGEVSGELEEFSYGSVTEQDVVALGTTAAGGVRGVRAETQRKTASFYTRIFKLRIGPGTGEDHLGQPSAVERGYTDPPNVGPSSISQGVPSDYPQTRADWDSVLLKYREKVRTLLRPST